MPIEFEGRVIELPASALADERVSTAVDFLQRDGMLDAQQARDFVGLILSEELATLGEGYVNEMRVHVQEIQRIRGELRTKYDAVLSRLRDRRSVPSDLQPVAFRELYNRLDAEIQAIRSPEAILSGSRRDSIFAGLTDEEINAAVDGAFQEVPEHGQANAPTTWEVPRVQQGRIGGIRVRRAKLDAQGNVIRPGGEILDIEDVEVFEGETRIEAVARLREVISRRISDTPLGRCWETARARALNGRTVESLGRDQAIALYDTVRDQFWQEVRGDPEARAFLEDRGFELPGDSGAALVEVNDPNVPLTQRRISLDHINEKAFGDNWRFALDADNLEFQPAAPNSFRDSMQRALRIGTYSR
jgi:hypothetical protein